MTATDLIAFENRIRTKWESGELPCLLHLCGGNEAQLLDLFTRIHVGDWIFSTHRNHYHALLAGIPAAKLEAMIDEGRSMFVYSREHNFLTSSILAGTCAIACGVALDMKLKALSLKPKAADAPQRDGHVWCFLGDGAEEEGHFYEAALFAEANDLPLTFIIEDNDRQVDTPTRERRGLFHSTHAPLDHFTCVKRYYYTPTYPHAGSGCAHKITFKPEAIRRLQSSTNL